MKKKTEQKNPQGIDKLAKVIEKQTGGKVKLVKLGFNPKRMVMWLVVIFFIMPFFLSLFSGPLPAGKVGLSQLLTDIKEGKVEKISVEEEKLLVKYKDQEGLIESRKEANESFVEVLNNAKIDTTAVNFETKDTSAAKAWANIMQILLPVILTGMIFLFIFKQARGSQDGLFSFGRSKAKLFMKGKQNVSFKDVAGVREAKMELEEIVDFLKHPKKYKAMGARTPKGVILIGPSGVGKTLLARAVAGESGVTFFSMAGSEFMEMLVGVGASVTGNTPVLVKDNGRVELVEIGKFIDQYYKNNQTDVVLPVSGIETLGLMKEKNGFWGSDSKKRPVFGGSDWRQIKQVYRHKVKEIFEIEYLGGKLKTTGDHSVFVREQGGIRAKEVRQLKRGDALVNLPMNTRAWDENFKKTKHKIKAHEFLQPEAVWLDVWQDDQATLDQYEFVMAQQGQMSQYAIAAEIGVSQATVGHWQRGIHDPQVLSKKLVKLNLPDRVKVSPQLCKLLGYYTAEGRGTNNLELTFSIEEKDYIEEVAVLMDQVFGLGKPVLEKTETNTIRVKYYSAHLGRFFATQCGNGSHNKHLPEWLWQMSKEDFLAYLEGYSNGDGYVTKTGKLSMSSVSHQLIRELAWLCSMHG
ncbi:AAA family ATPase, partial [Patescibacteria group bacterium]|nr:AAA family ATPase [Patescibacteria group bacterium]